MSAVFGSVLVANRGEIAVRITRTLRAMGIASVAVYSPADRCARHVSEADSAVALGSYLDVEGVVAAATGAGAGALHPGYGFLSENASLARACASAGVTFVGPPAAAIEMMGDKINAKKAVAAAGVPVVPGSNEAGLSDDGLAAAAVELGLPVLLKPSAGGGGKGMRRVDDPARLAEAIAAARREAQAAFGDATLLVEHFVARPRHIEVQVFADRHGAVVALGDRECSLQRRHQKIVEEAPSPLLDGATRAAMATSATDAARACGYVGAGTVEFIVSGERPTEYFFMEMNTRLQVEHPVTEAVTGIDLVEWQLRVAAGEPLPWTEAALRPKGHAVEARVYAEDPGSGFLPTTGRVLALVEPSGLAGVRVDSGLQAGTVVGTEYDPMLAKVVAWGDDRAEALARLDRALAATTILGVTTNVGFLRRLVTHPDVLAGRLDTELVDRVAPTLAAGGAPDHAVAAAAALTALLPPPGEPPGPWELPGAWRVGAPAWVVTTWRVGATTVEAAMRGVPGAASVRVGDGPPVATAAHVDGPWLSVESAGRLRRYSWAADGGAVWLGHAGDTWALHLQRPSATTDARAAAGGGRVTSPMPGTVLAVHVADGDAARAGQALVTVEAMKMEHVVAAPLDGTVHDLAVRPGQPVALGQHLATVAPSAEESGHP